MANIPLQYPFPYKTTNNTGFTSTVEFNTVTVLGDVTIDQNLTVAGNITTTDLTVGDDLTVGGTIDAQALRAFGIWDSPTATVTGAGAWIGFDTTGHTIFANRKATAGQTNSFRWYAYTETNAFQAELMRLSNAGNLFISGTRIEFPLVHLHQPPGSFPQYDFYLPSSMGGAGQVLTSAGSGLPTYWTTPSGGGGGGGTVTNVTGTSPISVTSPTTTPNISLTTIPTTLGGTGLTTVGTNGQVLSSNGTTLQYVTLPTPVTSVSATFPLASSGGATPTISIASATGLGPVVLQDNPTIINQFFVEAGTPNTGFFKFTSIANANYIQSGLSFTTGSAAPLIFTSINAGSEWMRISTAGNVSIGGSNGTSRLNIGDGSMDGARLGSVQITQDTTTIINTANNVAAISFVRSGNFTWGFGYLQSSNSFGLGWGVTSGFVPDRICVTTTGNVGIGTTTPAHDLDINKPGFGSAISFAVRDGFVAGFRTQWNYSGGQGETVFWNYRGGGTGGFWFKNLDTSNADGGFATITCGSIYSDGNVGIGTTSPLQKLHINNGRLRISDTSDAVIEVFTTSYANYMYTKASNGHFIFDVSTRCIGINTTTPVFKLDLRTESGTGAARFKGSPEALILDGTDHVFVRFAWNGVNNAYIGYGNAANTNFDINGHGNINIYPGSTSNVGINLSNPTSKLHVAGTTRATNFTTNGTNTFTYSETDFTPTIGFLTGSTNNFVPAAVGPSIPSFSYNLQTGRITRIGSIMTVVVDIEFNITMSVAAGPGIYIAIRLPAECRPSSLGATSGGSWPQTIDPGNMRGYVLLNGTDSGGNIAYISPVTSTERILWSIYGTSAQSNQRLFATITYCLR